MDDGMGAAAVAVRTDDQLGYTECVEFLDDGGGDRIMTSTSYPTVGGLSGVVICSSIGNEVVKNARREVLLGRALAARGTASVRFQYRGFGNSDGDPTQVTFDWLVEDALAAAGRLRQVVPTGPIGFIGTRYGALVAAAAAGHFPGAPVVLVEPVLKAADFYKEGLRTVLIQRATDREGRVTREQLLEQLHRDGFLDLLGYPLQRALYDSAITRTVLDSLGQGERRVLLVRMTSAKDAGAAAERSVTGWADRGLKVETAVVQAQETWWYIDEQELKDMGAEDQRDSDRERLTEPVGTAGLLSEILTWLAGALEPAEVAS